MNTKSSSPSPLCSSGIRISLNTSDPVPAFKNGKQWLPGGKLKSGKRAKGRLVTDPRKAAWMDKVILDIESALRSAIPTTAPETSTGHCPPSLIASYVPLDDSRQWIGEIHVCDQQVTPEQVGFDLVIERM